jgi:hypothetical protein
MAGQAVVRRAFLLVTIDTKVHGVIDNALCNRHLCEITMTHTAVDARENMWRMVEPDMRLLDEPIHAFPRYFFATLRVVA